MLFINDFEHGRYIPVNSFLFNVNEKNTRKNRTLNNI